MITEVRRNFWHAPQEVWRVIGRFDSFDWASGVGPLIIDAAQPRHQIGAIRAFRHHGKPTRQRLTSFRAEERSYSYETLEHDLKKGSSVLGKDDVRTNNLEPHHELPRYAATIAVSDGKTGGSTVNWTANFGMLVSPTARSFGNARATAFTGLFDQETEPTIAFERPPRPCDHWIAFFRGECRKSLDNVQEILDMALSG